MGDAQQVNTSQTQVGIKDGATLSTSKGNLPVLSLDAAEKILNEGRNYSNKAGDAALNLNSQNELDLAVKSVEYQARHKAVDLDQKWLTRSKVYNAIQQFKSNGDPDFPALQPTAYKEGYKAFNELKPENKTEESARKEIFETIDAGKIAKATGMLDAFIKHQRTTAPNYDGSKFVEETFEKICPID